MTLIGIDVNFNLNLLINKLNTLMIIAPKYGERLSIITIMVRKSTTTA